MRRCRASLLRLACCALLAGCVAPGGPQPSAAAAPGASGCRVERVAAFPVTLRRGFITVRATIEGTPVSLLLDTGAEAGMVTEEAVRALHLARDPLRHTALRGIGGSVVTANALLRRLHVGGIERRELSVPVGALTHFDGAGPPVAGILGADFLSAYDIEFDLPHRQLALYDVRHCEGAFIPWEEPYFTVALHEAGRNRLALGVQVDGHEVSALFDSGARVTVMGSDAAGRLGVDAAALARDPAGTSHGVDMHEVPFWLHHFAEFRVGGELFRDRAIGIAGLRLHGDGMLLGADYLAPRRVWLSYATGRLFVQRAGPRRLLEARAASEAGPLATGTGSGGPR